MAAQSGISWTDGTVNFVIGCQHAGPGCDACYAEAWAAKNWNIKFGPDGERRVTSGAFKDPLTWQKQHEEGRTVRVRKDGTFKTPTWVFACSLSDFFDNKWPDGVRDRAWQVIRDTPALRWQIVTKRVGNIPDMLPKDWDGGKNYQHVGFIGTMVNQLEFDRDMPKLANIKHHGAKWIGVSIEPQIGLVKLKEWTNDLDWAITGGESKQPGHEPRPYDMSWPASLIEEGAHAGVPIWVKQMGSIATYNGKTYKLKEAGSDMDKWPESLRVQQMPRIYDAPTIKPIEFDPINPEPERCPETPDLFK